MTPPSENAIAEAARGARTSYRIGIGDDQLDYHPAVIDDPVPTGLQILELAKARPADEHIVFQLLANGLLEELRPDETTDLRTPGVEKFLVFRSDRSFRLELDGRVFEWGGIFISGRTLKTLAQVDPAEYGVWLDPLCGKIDQVGIADRSPGSGRSAARRGSGSDRIASQIRCWLDCRATGTVSLKSSITRPSTPPISSSLAPAMKARRRQCWI